MITAARLHPSILGVPSSGRTSLRRPHETPRISPSLRLRCRSCLVPFRHASPARARGLTLKPLPRKFSASDTVTLGKTGIQTSRLAMGTGTVGSGHHSHQTALASHGLSRSSPQRLRPRSPLLRFRRQLWQSSPRRRSPQACSARQSHCSHQNLGTRRCLRSRRPRPLPPRARHRSPRHLPDALPHRTRLDRSLQRRHGRSLRSQGKGHHPRPRLLVPLHRSSPRRHHSLPGSKFTWSASIPSAQ